MPICKRCGEKYWAMELDENGRCKSCAQKASDQNAQTRIYNYDICRDGKSPPSMQRIYDAFIRKYPDALITGISVKDEGKKLLMYLDGSPSYYVTFNPLTNDVDLVKYSDALKHAEDEKKAKAEANAQAARNSNAGCSIWLSVFGLLYGLVCMAGSYLGGIVGIICSAIVLAGGASKNKGVVILGGALSFVAAVLGFPLSLGYVLFGIFYLCVGSEM